MSKKVLMSLISFFVCFGLVINGFSDNVNQQISDDTPDQAERSVGAFFLLRPKQRQTHQPEEVKPEKKEGNLNKVAVRGAAFFPMSSRFREIYGNIGTSLQLEAARTWRAHRNVETWGNVEWIFMDGAPRQSCGTTDINIINIDLGLKVIGSVYRDVILLYAGVGPNIGMVFIENKMRCCSNCDSNVLKENEFKVDIGLAVKTGSQFFLTPHFYLDLFADYLYLPIEFHRTVDVGGFKVGGGIGGRF